MRDEARLHQGSAAQRSQSLRKAFGSTGLGSCGDGLGHGCVGRLPIVLSEGEFVRPTPQ